MTVPNEELISTARTVSKYLWGECSTLLTQLVEALENARCEIWRLEARLADFRVPRVRWNLGTDERSATWRNADGELYRWNSFRARWVILTSDGEWTTSMYQPPLVGPYVEVVGDQP